MGIWPFSLYKVYMLRFLAKNVQKFVYSGHAAVDTALMSNGKFFIAVF